MPGSAIPGSMNLTYSNGHGYDQQELHAEFAHVPVGKQRRHPPRHPSSIWYTSSSGIWQTVWLEPVSLCLCLSPASTPYLCLCQLEAPIT